MDRIEVCENGLQATQLIDQLMMEGFEKDHIYLFAHGEERSKDLTDATDTGTVGLGEQGLVDSVSNVFRKRGDELRSKFESVGLSEAEAAEYERVLDEGKIVIVAKH
ncbi:general stress protein [Pseudogracilibacillus auburnensis]|uniref:general stress protein n=1 Tax=Pseudogracilibacillus auburnensis TaxID=1494959 RepID=UPI001A95DBEB|nr:general stress protein [Pseudogracilibacillus auburnensis]MBO1005318.1 general stress protein [Pseudogracilibacillus auburnensis]